MSDASALFPPGFVWGVATAAYQVEGATTADGRGPSIWDTFCEVPGAILGGDTGADGAQQYLRWREDIALMRQLNLGAYRFSIAWPRVQPAGSGAVNTPGLDYYDHLVDGLLEAGIQPWATLYHWDLPQPLQDAGGWPARQTAERYAEYAGIVAARLGDRVAGWSTLNEPWCSSWVAYCQGEHAPGHRDPREALLAAHHLLLAHGLGVRALRAAGVVGQVGTVLNISPTTPDTDDPADVDAAHRRDIGDNRLFLDPILTGTYPDDIRAEIAKVIDPDTFIRSGDGAIIGQPIDYLGINYYHPQRNAFDPTTAEKVDWPGRAGVRDVPLPGGRTAMGWPMDASGLHRGLLRIVRDYAPIPIYITENGAAFDDVVSPDGAIHDADRLAYLDMHVRAVADAIADGVDVRGYFAWSLLDNFEWAWGYARRFGIVRVDYDTYARTIKDSGHWFADLARTSTVPTGGAA